MMPEILPSQPTKWLTQIISFIENTYAKEGKTQAVIAISGGIDSAVSASLLVEALGPQAVTGLLLPYKDQDMADGRAILNHLGVPESHQIEVPIEPLVSVAAQSLKLDPTKAATDHLTKIRLGNLMARSRMLMVFDYARQLNALVCGTENKSEHYLGYFTRFGDAASDLEPISMLYKTQVRELAEFLELPSIFLSKAPSAGLWLGQTDEQELGFSYQEADRVLYCFIDQKIPPAKIAAASGVSAAVVTKVLTQVKASAFKLQVPYELS